MKSLWHKALAALALFLCLITAVHAERANARETINIDDGWRFAYGHATDTSRDFGYSTRAFFFAKAGYGDGPAAPNFNDSGWRKVDLPHDWAVELPFDGRGNTNHGSKAIGLNFPENSVGWYRRTLAIPASDKGRRISLTFDGVYRDSVLWVNGHYIGTEPSGYTSFQYDISDYLNYGGDNVIVMRVDATREEGWFYEGAGIYRHVWLTKTDDLHVAPWGIFVNPTVTGDTATVAVETTVANDGREAQTFAVDIELVGPDGHPAGVLRGPDQTLAAGGQTTATQTLTVTKPALWSLETPQLYRANISIRTAQSDKVDTAEQAFGIRTVVWDADKGFFLNGRHVELHGVNNHQDFAGIGVAVPDSVQDYRLKQLRGIGVNALRMSHNPPNPEVLDAADRLGFLVIDEHRMMGTTPEIRGQLEAMVRRDRNHPSVVLWSVGNEEWSLEWNPLGTHLADEMQYIVHRLDPGRRTTVATSGSGQGVSLAADVIGFNYHTQHDIDAFHKAHPEKPAAMTEEGSTTATRGIYVDDPDGVHLAAYDRQARPGNSASIEEAWRFTVARPFLAGMFVWTGYDYRGETTPFGWPAVSSQFGMLDTGGVVKDSGYYLKSVWTDPPMVHILPHWTWPDKIGPVDVRVYANTDEVELLLNGKSLGRKTLEKDGHLAWSVPYAPGRLVARGFNDGKRVAAETIETAGAASAVTLSADRTTLTATASDTTVVRVAVTDKKGRLVPDAGNRIAFETSGPLRIIGVGNGDPASHEADRPAVRYGFLNIVNWRSLAVDGTAGRAETAADQSTDTWRDPFQWLPLEKQPPLTPAVVLRGEFDAPVLAPGQSLQWLVGTIGKTQSVYLNGKPVTPHEVDGVQVIDIAAADLEPRNSVAYVFETPDGGVAKMADNSVGGTSWGQLRVITPAEPWQRQVFAGYAIVVVQSTGEPGEGRLIARGDGLKTATAVIQVQ